MFTDPTVLAYLVEAHQRDARRAADPTRRHHTGSAAFSLRRLFHLPAAARDCRAADLTLWPPSL